MAKCEKCESDNLELIEKLENGQKRIRCTACGNIWLKGEPVAPPVPRIEAAWKRFPKAEGVQPDVLEAADRLKDEYLHSHPAPAQIAVDFREKYRHLFSQDGLTHLTGKDIRFFANANRAGNPGNMSVFNRTWNEMGEEAGTREVKAAIEYLLYGPAESRLEDRLTDLIEDRKRFGMMGFKEALLTKVLCMVEPDRWLPINKYTGQAGKKEIAKWVYDLDLPKPEKSSSTIGRLIVWSNDLLRELAGAGFQDTEHAAGFLWWAKDEMRLRAGEKPTGTADLESDSV